MLKRSIIRVLSWPFDILCALLLWGMERAILLATIASEGDPLPESRARMRRLLRQSGLVESQVWHINWSLDLKSGEDAFTRNMMVMVLSSVAESGRATRYDLQWIRIIWPEAKVAEYKASAEEVLPRVARAAKAHHDEVTGGRQCSKDAQSSSEIAAKKDF